MRKVNINNLPQTKISGVMRVDWKSLNNEKVSFEYDGIIGKIVLTYSHSKPRLHYLTCTYQNNTKIYPMHTIQQGLIGSLVKPHPNSNKPTQENWLYQRTDLHKFTDNPDDLKNYHLTSNKYYTFKCHSCGKKLRKCINSVERNGVSCDVCSSSYSRNERLVSSILTKIGETYEPQKYFDGCIMTKPLPFDFYLPRYNMVIETHGEQHYKDTGYFDNYEKVLESDKIKEKYCKDNNIKYCVIDCSKRKNEETIKKLEEFINIELTDGELKECMWESLHNISEVDLETAKNLYDCYWNYREIGDYFGVSHSIISEILKESGIDIRKENFKFENSLLNIVNNKSYGNQEDFRRRECSDKNKKYVWYHLNNNSLMRDINKNYLCIVRKKDLKLDADKSHLKKVYKEAMKQLNENKENPFDKYVGCDVDTLIEESDNQRELMLHLNNLPLEYRIKNGIVIKK